MPHTGAPGPREPHTRRGRLALALAVSLAVILAAPYLGQLRAMLRSAFPGQFAAIVGAAVLLAVGAALGAALLRIRDRRAARFGVIAASLAGALLYIAATGTGNPEVDAVERVHFVEYGLIACLFYAAWRPLGDPAAIVLPVLAALTVGTLDEWLQWFIPNRVGEARDVLLNLVAIACGLAFGAALDPPREFSRRLHASSRRLTGAVAAVAVLVFAAFVDVVHMGHAIDAPGIGQFRSRYTHDELHALALDRAARWRTNPPLALVRLSREDQYLDEGLWHVRARNRQWAAGLAAEAWRENLILETYFAPVLDTKTYAAPDVHRWPPEQRADAQARALHAAGSPYASTAEPYPILVWSRPVFWTVAALVLALPLAWGARVRPAARRGAAPSPPFATR